MTVRIALVNTLIVCGFLSSCAQYAKVTETRPKFGPARTTLSALGKEEKEIADGLKLSKRDPLMAMGDYLAAAQAASQQLTRTPNDAAARDDYNFAVARLFTMIRDAKLDPWTKPLAVPSPGGEFVLTQKPDSRDGWNPAHYEVTPADQYKVSGLFITERTIKQGLGAPLVAVGRADNPDAKETFSNPRACYGVTAVAHFTGRRCEISLEDPLATETVKVNGHTFPLAADFTAPLAVWLASSDQKKMGLARLLNPGKYADTARITRMQPYDPNKTVVLVVHGLNSSPATWTPMINALRGDEAIRRNYQFWLYSYPSGYPYPLSAAILRKELDAIEKKFLLRKKMVVIGHSMGGCISRLLLTDVGDELWMKTFGKPLAQTEIAPETKQKLADSLVFKHRPEVGRVIFVAAPLRGADMAKGWLGRLGSMLVKSPFALAQAGKEMLKLITFQGDDLKLTHVPNSVDTMAPNNRFVKNINTFPLSSTIPFHAIIGDRGKGGNKDKTKPICSDGFVPYWSSHLPEAQSELIVPSGHSAHQNPLAIAEVKRILFVHAGKSTQVTKP